MGPIVDPKVPQALNNGRVLHRAPSVVVGLTVLVYSVFFFVGVKEGHNEHWIWAALLFGLNAASLSRQTFAQDLLFVFSGLALLHAMGLGYWAWQDGADQDFSFENDYLAGLAWFWGFAGFFAGWILRLGGRWLFKKGDSRGA